MKNQINVTKKQLFEVLEDLYYVIRNHANGETLQDFQVDRHMTKTKSVIQRFRAIQQNQKIKKI